jgi:hypothetical protein
MVRTKIEVDTIIEEIHQTRRRIAEKFGGDIATISEDARRRQMASGRPVWCPRSSAAEKPAGSTTTTSSQNSPE